ncbi:GIN domain-containing protein [Reichenbachiella ulvae]|uniref:PspC domain-containing protein n=1 Tax=Reichenbachiella ulvae TaxID=2980104 RepID=A0ABT3CQ03_9BACT|nr:DUF2807 domain-containing protein [Reichenbachiella ulvae]MCV9385651.1 PspC domain-containing protein [Reichenbachiella ulvae]
MKKNISINISGIIFHIEEDGYSSLKSYLESINRYFSSYEDSIEIISDIEGRIAEIFLSKLSDGKQVITLEDVESLIQTMGTVADFDAAENGEEEEKVKEEPKTSSDSSGSKKEKAPPSDEEDIGKKRLFRDDRRKVLGGVASGMAYFFSIDPLWIRLVFVALLLNVFNFGFSGGVFLAYILLWIVIPVSKDLGDEESVKRLFRDPENQVLGGISSGIAAYFGIDVTIVRLLFVLSIFLGGSGVILYIILWMITPVAKTITEKMQMQGEPVTLSNIQQTVNKTLKNKEGEESTFAKILLFPFRIISELFRVIGELLGPISQLIFNIIRVFAGILVTLVGISAIMALFGALGVMIGLFSLDMHMFTMGAVPVDIVPQSFPVAASVGVFIVGIMPLLVITLLGISLLAKRFVISAAIGWSVFGIWLLGIIMAAFTVPGLVADFRTEGEYREVVRYELDKESPVVIKLSPEEMNDITRPELRLRPTEDSVFRLVVEKEARGRTREEASQNAQMISYKIRQIDNELIFDPHFEYTEEARFRVQQLKMVLYVPMGQEFIIEKDVRGILRNFGQRQYSRYDIEDNVRWVYTQDGLQCVNCKPSIEDTEEEYESDDDMPGSRLDYYGNDGEDAMVFEFENFDQLALSGYYKVFVEKGEKYNVIVNGSDDLKSLVRIQQTNSLLSIGLKDEDWDILDGMDEEKLEVYITMPSLTGLESGGACELHIGRFENESFEIKLMGASNCEMDIKTNDLEIDLSGASKLKIQGSTDALSADVSGASNLRAYDLRAKKVDVKAGGASNARVNARESLSAEVSGISNVKYKGNPSRTALDESGLGKVRSVD